MKHHHKTHLRVVYIKTIGFAGRFYPERARLFHAIRCNANAVPMLRLYAHSLLYNPSVCTLVTVDIQVTRRSVPVASLPLRSLPVLLPPKFC
jgi:hypothetical protein